jgi:hypothetical protein
MIYFNCRLSTVASWPERQLLPRTSFCEPSFPIFSLSGSHSSARTPSREEAFGTRTTTNSWFAVQLISHEADHTSMLDGLTDFWWRESLPKWDLYWSSVYKRSFSSFRFRDPYWCDSRSIISFRFRLLPILEPHAALCTEHIFYTCIVRSTRCCFWVDLLLCCSWFFLKLTAAVEHERIQKTFCWV